jgi:hypothetical protein
MYIVSCAQKVDWMQEEQIMVLSYNFNHAQSTKMYILYDYYFFMQ